MVIDCDSCRAPADACGDCVVSVLLGTPDPRLRPVTLDTDHARAVEVLADCGLVPPLRQTSGARQVG